MLNHFNRLKTGQFLFAVLILLILPVLLLSADDNDVLHMTIASGSIQLDPAHSYTTTEAQLYTALYEGLVSYHPLTLEPVPAAASRWVISPDGRVYTFFLRPEGHYWNGETVTAEDFSNAWFRLLDPDENAEYSFLLDPIVGASEYRNGQITDKDKVGIKVIDHLTLQVTLKEPSDYFLKVLCHHAFAPVNPLNLKDGKWKNGPSTIGNGPFMLYSQSADSIILKKNILYWDAENVSLSEIDIEYANDPDSVTERFNNGEVLWAPSGLYFGQITNSNDLVTNPLFGTTYFFFSSKQKPFDNPEIRRALCLMLPWERIRNNHNFYLPTHTLVPSILGYPQNDGINKRNMQEALKLLYEAGYMKGSGLGTIKICIPESQDNLYIADIMKSTWEKFLDVTVEIDMSDYDTYFDKLKTDTYTLGTTSWIGDFADPMTFLQMWTSDSNLNDSGYSNAKYDELLQESIKERDTKNRYHIMAEAEKILLDSGVVLPLENSPAFNAVKIDILEGWFPNVLDIHPFKYFQIRKMTVPDGTT